MGSLYKRSLTKHGGSYEVILPKGWVEFYHLKAGDEITMVVDDLLIICPPGLEDKARAIMETKSKKQTAEDRFFEKVDVPQTGGTQSR